MNGRRVHRVVVIVGLLVLLTSLPVGAQTTLRLAQDPWPPYVDDKLAEGGLAVRIVREVLRRAGYRMTLELVPWARALRGATMGTYDGFAAAWVSDARRRDFLFSTPYLRSDIRYVRRLGTFTPADPTGLTVAAVRGYAYGGPVDRAGHFTKALVPSVEVGLRLLMAARVDLLIGDERVVTHLLRTRFADRLGAVEFVGAAIRGRRLHFAVSRARPDAAAIVADFNTALAAMAVDGSLAALGVASPLLP